VARARVLRTSRDTMRATVFRGVGQFGVEEVPRPHAGPGDAVIRVTLTTICGTDLHIVRGEYAVRAGLAESAHVRPGDAVVVFAQGPIGLCATAGARLMGASLVIGVDGDDARLAMAKRMGADVVLDYRAVDVAAEVQRLTGGGADIAIEALGTQQTFESALRSLRPAGTLSSLGVYSGKLAVPYDAFAAGLGDYRIVTTLCPGGKERMRRLMELVRAGRLDLMPLLTHSFPLDRIGEAYELFGSRGDGVLKVAITP
jgi:alcohol dehydrogenase